MKSKFAILLCLQGLAVSAIGAPTPEELLGKYTPSCQPYAAEIIVSANTAFALLTQGKPRAADMQLDRTKEAVLATMQSDQCSLTDLQLTLKVGDDVHSLQTAAICGVRIQEVSEYMDAIELATAQADVNTALLASESIVWTLTEIEDSLMCDHLPDETLRTLSQIKTSLERTLSQIKTSK